MLYFKQRSAGGSAHLCPSRNQADEASISSCKGKRQQQCLAWVIKCFLRKWCMLLLLICYWREQITWLCPTFKGVGNIILQYSQKEEKNRNIVNNSNDYPSKCTVRFETLWTVAHQAPLSMRFSRQEYWSGLPFPSPGDLPNPGIEPRSPTLQADTLTSEPPGKPLKLKTYI